MGMMAGADHGKNNGHQHRHDLAANHLTDVDDDDGDGEGNDE